MIEIASQITLCLLIAAFIGFIIGYSAGKWGAKKTAKKVEATPKEETKTVTEEETVDEKANDSKEEAIEIPTKDLIANAVEAIEEMENIENSEVEEPETIVDKGTKPELLDAPRESGKDDLTEIKGIGPKVEEKLNEAGIYHYDQIANWTESNILWLETHTTFAHRAIKDLWVNQAKSLL